MHIWIEGGTPDKQIAVSGYNGRVSACDDVLHLHILETVHFQRDVRTKLVALPQVSRGVVAHSVHLILFIK